MKEPRDNDDLFDRQVEYDRQCDEDRMNESFEVDENAFKTFRSDLTTYLKKECAYGLMILGLKPRTFLTAKDVKDCNRQGSYLFNNSITTS